MSVKAFQSSLTLCRAKVLIVVAVVKSDFEDWQAAEKLQQGSLNNLCNFYATQGYYIIDDIIDCILFWIVSLFDLGGFLDFVFFFPAYH